MKTDNNDLIDLLQLSEEAFFQFGEKEEDNIVDALIIMNDFEGTAINAPLSIDVSTKEQFPLLWVRRASGLRNWQVEELRNSVVVVSDLINGKVGCYNAFAGPKKINLNQVPHSASGEKPDRDRAESATVRVNMLDLRIVTNLPWQSRRMAIALLMYDWVSNTSIVELIQSEQNSSSQEAISIRFARDSAIKLMKKFQDADKTPDPEIRFAKETEALKLKEPGIVLSVPDQFKHNQVQWLVSGAVKIAVCEAGLVEEDLEKKQTVKGKSDASLDTKQVPEAVVNLMLLVNQLDEPFGRQINIQLPVISDKALKAGDIVELSFTYDLKRILNEAPDGTYQVFLIGGEYLNGPHSVVIEK